MGGCAGAAGVTGVATQQDLFELRSELIQAQQTAQRAKSEADALAAQLDRRAREQTAASERQAAAIAQRLDGLATSLGALVSRVDELTTRVEALARQLRAAAPAPAAPTPATPPPPTPAPALAAPAAVPARPTTGALQPRDVYQAAYIDFSKGSYSLAIAGFREFVRRYPEHDLAGNAQYWIGEAYLSLARGYANADQTDRASESLNQAAQEFRKVLANYPRAEKVSAALYKEALALIELKQPQQAQARLQYLVDNFPQSEEMPLARERLAALKK
ncbi:MAG: outer membrane protein assembly factor BamD [Candidatus Rokubacteria bacterium]|nr:outer membrane protein assembly factor BamD [Candidatus Rokubacteria bacterium]